VDMIQIRRSIESPFNGFDKLLFRGVGESARMMNFVNTKSFRSRCKRKQKRKFLGCGWDFLGGGGGGNISLRGIRLTVIDTFLKAEKGTLRGGLLCGKWTGNFLGMGGGQRRGVGGRL